MSPSSWGALATVVAVSACLTWAARVYALRRQLLDQPGERRSHHVATPRGGGVAIVLTLLLAAGLAALNWPGQLHILVPASLGLAMVAGIGWWDDHRPLPAWSRLVVHMLASAILAALVVKVGGSWWHAALAFCLCVCLINIWNFMDGINGIATTQAITAAAAFACIVPWPFSLPGLLLALACVGFLPFNVPRARIFMGDVGSGALGYALACLAALAHLLVPINWLLLIVPFSAFVVDAGFTLVSRMLTGQRWTQPHTQHVYQRAVKAGRSHMQVTSLYMIVGLLSTTLLLLAAPLEPLQQAGVAVAWWGILSCLWWFLRMRLRNY